MIYIIFQIKNIFIYIIKDKHLKTNKQYIIIKFVILEKYMFTNLQYKNYDLIYDLILYLT